MVHQVFWVSRPIGQLQADNYAECPDAQFMRRPLQYSDGFGCSSAARISKTQVLECFISPNLPSTYQEPKKGGSRGQGSGSLLTLGVSNTFLIR
ncbi:unnamed protein product [Calypogeia fissa]